ncbi:DUF1254 domain-containing protein [Shewanella sp. OMA3-2]|uniref:DUF1254 domain-containing protein n=1 Tax=Shewanella sp. OMA3-2 TaxID=2908650 RepID=UPI001F295925|nr:DUF1254 domain-containing protein [Shewanella sp. OMA3-2]UJF22725.1 DUF1254 domain-containing protein [Shewanella sp. OMA3-2]
MRKINQAAWILASIGVALTGAQTAQANVSEQQLQQISMPNKVETSIGTLEFFDGVPNKATIDTVYDNLDRMRAVQVFLDHQGAGSLNAMRKGNASIGADSSNNITITEQLLKSESLYLTGNTSTLYALAYIDLKTEGPLVVELPPGMLGFVDDAWFRYVTDLGVIGQNKGKGGKYLWLPPGYKGEVPEGYFVIKSKTYNNLMFLRGSIDNGLEPAVNNIKSSLKVYPLSKVANPPATQFTNISGKRYSTLLVNDLSFYEDLNTLVQVEPIDAISAESRGLLASIGIVKGQAFTPDDRMKKLLNEAAVIGAATARAITYEPRIDGVFIYPDTQSAWTTGYANKNTSFETDGAMGLDARVLFYYNATGVTPAMAIARAGQGSDYALAYVDANKQAFDGAKTYKLHLPPNVPVNNFWAATLYDTQTRSLLQTGQTFPTVSSQDKAIEMNTDGSFDIYFSPQPPKGKEGNWVQTVPGKSWFTILRMYGPLEPWLNKTWRPSEIELVK